MSKALEEAFNRLPHGDRVCEQQGKCTCGRNEAIAVIRGYLKASSDLLAIREEQIGEFLEEKKEQSEFHITIDKSVIAEIDDTTSAAYYMIRLTNGFVDFLPKIEGVTVRK
jgi:hypothetical protein